MKKASPTFPRIEEYTEMLNDDNLFYMYLSEHNIAKEHFNKTGIKKQDILDVIVKGYWGVDHHNYFQQAQHILEMIQSHRIESISSYKFRVKSPDSLIGKLIRKEIKDFTLSNLNSYINDIIGIRLLYVFEHEWEVIHDFILTQFSNVTEVEFYHDNELSEIEKARILDKFPIVQFKNKKNGYKSIHYKIELSQNEIIPDKYPISDEPRRYYCEVQIRTLFQEAWGEVSHNIVYPKYEKNDLLKGLTYNLNTLSNGADKLATYLLSLRNQLIAVNNKEKDWFHRISFQSQQIRQILGKLQGKETFKNEILSLLDEIEMPPDGNFTIEISNPVVGQEIQANIQWKDRLPGE